MNTSALWAGQLRQSRREKNNIDRHDDNSEEATIMSATKAIRNSKANKKKAVKKKVKELNGAKIATNRLLAFSWLNLIPSFGLSLIWINVHIFMHTLFPSVFGKLGEEWVPGQAQAGEASGATKTANKAIGIAETLELVFLDLLFILLILGAIAILMFLFDAIFGILGYIFDWLDLGTAEEARRLYDAQIHQTSVNSTTGNLPGP